MFPWGNVFFLSVQSAGVMSVYLFMKRYTAEEIYQPHPSFYRPRLSNCSDYSGQFLHPDAWTRGRSPSDISSDASLQMNASYPALLKCPDYDQVSSSPCWRTGSDAHISVCLCLMRGNRLIECVMVMFSFCSESELEALCSSRWQCSILLWSDSHTGYNHWSLMSNWVSVHVYIYGAYTNMNCSHYGSLAFY